MPIQSNVPNPVGLDQWRQMAASDKARVTVDGNGGLDTNNVFMSFFSQHLSSTHTSENQAAFDNLFSAIHADHQDPDLRAAVRVLLNRARDAGESLTPALIRQALHVADNFAPPGCDALCRKWDEAGRTDVLSPRTPRGAAFLHEFTVTLGNRMAQLGLDPTRQARLDLLEAIRQEVRDEIHAGPEIKEKVDSMLRLEQQQIRFGEHIRTSEHPYLKPLFLPEQDAFKLVMDGEWHDGGAYAFENERGYMAGMLTALNFMLETLDEPLTPELYRSLHDTAVEGVHRVDRMGEDSLFKLGFRDGVPVQFEVRDGSNLSLEGLREFAKSAKARDPENWITLQYREDRLYLVANAKTAQQCREKATAIIDAYRAELAQAQGDETAILRCIAKCCQDLDQHHLFSDGNIRTAGFLTLNKLLLQNGLSPALFQDPNVLDMKSLDQLVDHIRAGQQQYRSLLLIVVQL